MKEENTQKETKASDPKPSNTSKEKDDASSIVYHQGLNEDNHNILSLKEKEAMISKVAKKWLEENKDLLSNLSPDKAQEIANRVAIKSINSALKQQSPTPNSPEDHQNDPQQAQQLTQGQQTGSVLAAATRIATATSALVTGILTGTVKGGVAGVHAGGNLIKNSLGQAKQTRAANERTNYANELVDQTSDRMFEKTDSIYDSLTEMTTSKENGTWTDPVKQERVYGKIESDLNNLNELKNTLKNDAMRDGVSPEKRKEINDNLTSINDFLTSFDDSLNDNEREKGLNKQANKIAKAIERILKSIKDLLFRSDNDKTPKPQDDEPSYEP